MGKSTSHSTTRKLSRAQVAKIMGVPDYEVAAMDGQQLHPIRSRSRVWQYDVDEVGAAMKQKMAALSKTHAEPDGATMAAVFALFEAKVSLPKIVVKTQQPLSLVVELRSKYDEWHKSVTISASAVRQLCALLGQEFHNARGLYPAVRRALEARLEEGRADCLEFGEVLDPITGKPRPVGPKLTTLDAGLTNTSDGTSDHEGDDAAKDDGGAGNDEE